MAVGGGLVVGARGVGSRAGRTLGGNLQTKKDKTTLREKPNQIIKRAE